MFSDPSQRANSRRFFVAAASVVCAAVVVACAAPAQPGTAPDESSTSAGATSAGTTSPGVTSASATDMPTTGMPTTAMPTTESPATDQPAAAPPIGTFTATAVKGKTLIAGSTLKVTFTGRTVAASAGCNMISGSVDVGAERITSDALAITEMGCEPFGAHAEQDKWVAELLSSASWKLDGDALTLSNDSVTVTLTRTGSMSETSGPDATVPVVPPVTVSDGPVVTPVPSRPGQPGASVPPTARPDDGVTGALSGKTYKMVRTWTDAGGVDHMKKGLDFRITFAADSATVTGDCTLTYPKLLQIKPPFGQGIGMDFGNPDGKDCVVGSDPPMPPSGQLAAFIEGKTLTLSTGFLMWVFEEVTG